MLVVPAVGTYASTVQHVIFAVSSESVFIDCVMQYGLHGRLEGHG
jgi:hypothetical protein